MAGLFRDQLGPLIRYGVVGVLQNGFFYALNLGLIALDWQGWQSIALLYPTAVVVSFLANKYWSFSGRRTPPGQFARTVAVYVAVYVVALAFVWTLERFGFEAWLATLLSVPVNAVLIFCAFTFWVFPKAQTTSASISAAVASAAFTTAHSSAVNAEEEP